MPSFTDLLDANVVWLALAGEGHAHHDRAKAYWEKGAAPVERLLPGDATCLFVATANRGINSSLGMTAVVVTTALLVIGFVLGTGIQVFRRCGD